MNKENTKKLKAFDTEFNMSKETIWKKYKDEIISRYINIVANNRKQLLLEIEEKEADDAQREIELRPYKEVIEKINKNPNIVSYNIEGDVTADSYTYLNIEYKLGDKVKTLYNNFWNGDKYDYTDEQIIAYNVVMLTKLLVSVEKKIDKYNNKQLKKGINFK